MISGEETVRTDSTYSLDIRVETEFRGPMLDSDRGYMTLIYSLFFFYHKKRDRITQNDVSFFSNGSHKSTSYCDHLNVLRVSNVCVRE